PQNKKLRRRPSTGQRWPLTTRSVRSKRQRIRATSTSEHPEPLSGGIVLVFGCIGVGFQELARWAAGALVRVRSTASVRLPSLPQSADFADPAKSLPQRECGHPSCRLRRSLAHRVLRQSRYHSDSPRGRRNVTMQKWGFLANSRYLLHDRDSKFCPSFRQLIEAGRVKTMPLPARSPNLNAYAERWVRSVKQECLSKLILFGERPLRRALQQYVAHYHEERQSP